MNYNARGCRRPCQHFLRRLRVLNCCGCSRAVIVVIISSFWGLKLGTREASRPPPPLSPPLVVPKSRSVLAGYFLECGPLAVCTPSPSWSPHLQKDWPSGLGDQGQGMWVGATHPFRAQACLRPILACRGSGRGFCSLSPAEPACRALPLLRLPLGLGFSSRRTGSVGRDNKGRSGWRA